MDETAYKKYLKEKMNGDEMLCSRCGECCGAGNDPCADLIKDDSGRYACKVYESRIGPRTTVSGKVFTCVAIRDNIGRGFNNPDCAYIQKKTKERNGA